jgi:hypothetical protein
MSLAMYAAPFNDDLTQINYNNVNPANNSDNLNGKRKPNNKTQKNYPKDSSEKVNSVLQSIHNLPPPSTTDQTMSDFIPIPPPSSAGVENTRLREYALAGQQPVNSSVSSSNNSTDQNPVYPSYFNQAMKDTTDYSQFTHANPIQSSSYSSSTSREDILMTKLNYMINLLEQSQDEKTNNVTEEIILYCFLGIFIIFVVDSFVRVGKYVR